MLFSILLGKVFAIALIAVGISLVLYRKDWRDVANEILGSKSAIYLTAFLELIIGLLVVFTHNVWVSSWPVVITIFGWLMVIEALVYLLFPHKHIIKVYRKWMRGSWYNVMAIVSIILGLYFAYFVFF